jgi:hypothetical protein
MAEIPDIIPAQRKNEIDFQNICSVNDEIGKPYPKSLRRQFSERCARVTQQQRLSFFFLG